MAKKIIIFFITFVIVASLMYAAIFKIIPYMNDYSVTNKKADVEDKEIKEVKKGTGIVDDVIDEKSGDEDVNDSISDETKSETNSKVREKIMKLRKRYEVKGIIIAGDIYSKKTNYDTALEKYMDALEQAPGDEKILKKIGNTYFEMKKYSFAYKYYQKMKDVSTQDTQKVLLSLLYSREVNSGSIGQIISDIKDMGLESEEEFYYETSVNCIKDFHECKKSFGSYFEEHKEITFEPLKDIEESIKNYENFQVEEVYYKNALIIGSFFSHKLYPIAINLGKNLLIEKKGYRPILQIIGKSYYELGNYDSSKSYLAKYYEKEKEDSSVMYLLGVIDLEMGDYLISNILLKEALDFGYENRADARRMIIYNYYMLGRMDKVIESFKFLMEEGEGLDIEDYKLAIYYHIINGENDYARTITESQIINNPEEDTFYTYLGWIEMEEGNLDEAKSNFNKAMDIDSRNPMTNYNYGLLELKKGKKTKAFIYFKRTSKEDKIGEYGNLARKALLEIKAESKTSSGSTSSGSLQSTSSK